MLESLATTILDSAAKKAIDFLGHAVSRENDKLLEKQTSTPTGTTVSNGVGLQRLTGGLIATQSVVRDALKQHIAQVRRWSLNTTFSDLRSNKNVANVHIELDTFVVPLRAQIDERERNCKVRLRTALVESSDHIVILGQPGAGKTTSLQKLCSEYFNSGKVLLNYNFPILVRLRELRESTEIGPLFAALLKVLAISIHVSSELGGDSYKVIRRSLIEGTILEYIEHLNVVLLLDGFDEVANVELRDKVFEDIRHLSRGLTKSKLIVTSRSGDFPVMLEGAVRLEISPLSIEQVSEFAARWLATPSLASEFVSKVAASPYADTALRPLTIAHLCAVYERVGDIPDKPKSVYKKIVSLMIEEWDAQRDIKRTTKYAGFEVDRKLEFLSALAFTLTTTYQCTKFDSITLDGAYKLVCEQFDLPLAQSRLVVAEIESHSGLIIETSQAVYEFAHKSLQEYLTAEYLVRLPSIGHAQEHIGVLPNELAIATSLSSFPSEYFSEVVLRAVGLFNQPPSFYRVFATRLVAEKPNLRYTREGAIAASLLLIRLGEDDRILTMLQCFFKHDLLQSLLSHYEVSSEDDENLRLTRRLDDPKFPLPSTVIVPRELLGKTHVR